MRVDMHGTRESRETLQKIKQPREHDFNFYTLNFTQNLKP